ncbi:MAG TPA: transporter substrate-binding domain-containing protein [Vicinamibacterales bacterium]|jgi:membrane-bound lytic murein transglycosylase MltF
MTKWAFTLGAVLALAACTDARESTPANSSPAAASLIEIPRAPAQPASPPSQLQDISNPLKGDLDEMLARGYIRVLATPSPTNYTVVNGLTRGRTHDVREAFQKFLNQQNGTRKVAVLLIDTPEDALVTDLVAGKGDIAANVLLNFERDEQVAFAAPLLKGIRELIVTGPKEPPLVSLEDVGGRMIHVRRSSDHYASLVRLNEQLKGINRPPAKIVLAAPDASDESLLEKVNSGAIPATVADDYLFGLARGALTQMAANRDVAVSQDGVLAWVTRKDAPKLLAAMNAFFSTHKLTY